MLKKVRNDALINSIKKVITVLLLFVAASTCAQNVRTVDDGILLSPWCGGLNACQFGQIDLNGDGVNDLVAFDRHGGRVSCFVNKGGVGEVNYECDNSYSKHFPRLTDWAIFADYDGDGRNDIFTYSKGWAGIKVYRNVSADSLAFELVAFPYLTSWQSGGEVNILATNTDYPAIVDVDGDGDLDILTFGVLGTFIEKHLNLSVERYGTRDSLVFERTDFCWGRVAESEEDNVMYLDTCLFGNSLVVDRDVFRHRGATFAVRDLNGNGLPDLLLADVDYPGLIYLQNGGDLDKALMVSQTSQFPGRHPVNLNSMPVSFFGDVNNDGLDDLIVSPFDPNPMVCEGLRSVWLYLNCGSSRNPDYHFYSDCFLQDQMIDVGTGAYPVFADVDCDGLTDMVVGAIGDIDTAYYHNGSLQTQRSAQLYFYRNVGIPREPSFQLVNDDFAQLKSQKMMSLIPAFGDINGDGKNEMIVGSAEGNLMLYDSDFQLVDVDYLNHQKTFSTPCLFDFDRDGWLDLVVGNSTGRLSYFQGSSMGYQFVTDDFGLVDVHDASASYFGYSVPFVFRDGNETFLAVGSEQGKLFLFNRIDDNLNGAFTDISDQWNRFAANFDNHFGMRSSVALADLNADGRLEMVVGNFAGGLQIFNANIHVSQQVAENGLESVSIFPNPAKSEIEFVTPYDSCDEIKAFDLIGRCVKKLTSTTCIDVSDLCPGIYFLEVSAEGRTYRGRFIKVS